MAVDFPFAQPGFCPNDFQWGAAPQTIGVVSRLSGGIQTQGMPGKRWTVAMTLPATTQPAIRAAVEAFFDSLNGQEVRVNLWHFGRIGIGGRGYPMGTTNQTGVQVRADTAQFALSIPLKGIGAGKTIEPGDLLKVGDQLMMAPPGVLTADGSGNVDFPVTSGLREAALSNAAVTLIKPTAQFVLANPEWRATYRPGASPEFGIDWIEAFSS